MAADFGNLLNNEMNEFKIQKSSLNQAASDVSAKSDKLDMLNQLHKLETKNVEGKLLVSDAKDLLQKLRIPIQRQVFVAFHKCIFVPTSTIV